MDRLITTIGSGSADVSPDRAHVDVRVGSSRPSVTDATAAMSDRATEVIGALRQAGAESVSTSRLSIRTDHDNQGQPRGFRAETAVRAVIAATEGSGDLVSEVLAAAVAAGGDMVSVDGVGFLVSDDSSAQLSALAAAVADARTKAEHIAAAAGVSLGSVVTVEQLRSGDGPMPIRALRAEASGPPVSPGAITVTEEVRVVFGLE